MERKVSKLLVVTGLIAGASVALLPLTTYAEGMGATPDGLAPCIDDPAQACPIVTTDPYDIELNVESKISIDTATGTGLIHIDPNSSNTGKISATVTSNQAYNILLKAAQPNLVHDTDPTAMIVAKDALTPASQAWWGIKKADAAPDDYTGLTTTDEVFFSNPTGAEAQLTEFEVKVTAPAGTVTGTYKTDVTITAAPSTT